MSRPHVQLGGERWNLWRLADEEFRTLGQHALPIKQNYELLLQLNHGRQAPSTVSSSREPSASNSVRPFAENPRGTTLGQLVTALEYRFGRSSTWFDGYRGSFAFPLLLTLQRQRRFSYLLRCHDHRGLVYFPLYRVVLGDPNPEERSAYHDPVADEFSQDEMDGFVTQFHAYLCDTVPDITEPGVIARYYRAIASDLILYGYDGSAFFEHQYDSLPQYEAARTQLERDLGWRHPRTTSNRIERMIDRVTEESRWGVT